MPSWLGPRMSEGLLLTFPFLAGKSLNQQAESSRGGTPGRYINPHAMQIGMLLWQRLQEGFVLNWRPWSLVGEGDISALTLPYVCGSCTGHPLAGLLERNLGSWLPQGAPLHSPGFWQRELLGIV